MNNCGRPVDCATNASVVASGDSMAAAPNVVDSDASTPMLANSFRGVGAGADRQGVHTSKPVTSATSSVATRAHGSTRTHMVRGVTGGAKT